MARERKIKIEEAELVITPMTAPKEVRPQWRVKSGGITLLDKRYFEKDQLFNAWEEDIPEAFRDIIIPMQQLEKRPTRVRPVFSLQEVVPTAEEEDENDYVQLYNIVNGDGKVISQKPLPKAEVDPLIQALNS